MYVMGHYIEAGVAYWQVTGNEQALQIACRMADCLDANFGDEDGKIPGADGHPEIELALARLYEATNESRYLRLARYFIDVRGKDPDFYDEQNKAVHAEGLPAIFPAMEIMEPRIHADRAPDPRPADRRGPCRARGVPARGRDAGGAPDER